MSKSYTTEDCSRFKKTRETWQLQAMCDPGLCPGAQGKTDTENIIGTTGLVLNQW